QAEDGIRDRNVTGVQTCALPISPAWTSGLPGHSHPAAVCGALQAEPRLPCGTVRAVQEGELSLRGRGAFTLSPSAVMTERSRWLTDSDDPKTEAAVRP